jgi:hypothetical protein
MSNQEYTRYSGQGKVHEGPDHASPYPVSRLAPAVDLVDMAAEIAQADQMLGVQLEGKLGLIAEQIRTLQEQARDLLAKAKRDQELHRSRCTFKRIPGKTYYLYRDRSGALLFSMLSPQEWGASLPYDFKGAYRLEPDRSWSPVEQEND